MAENSLPSTMRIWRYTSTVGGLEAHLHLHTSEPLPHRRANQHLVQVIACGLNPVDYKPAEAPIAGSLMVKKPATPGFDVAGRVVVPAEGSTLEPGQSVYGTTSTNPFGGGGLAEYIAAPPETLCPIPLGVQPLMAAGAPVAAVTAHDSIIPYVQPGSRIFLNGGSGGVGTYAIQIAKAVGAHVTVSCSATNADLCLSLGADEVLDYKKRPLLEQLRDAATTHPFDHIVDNVFNDPALYFEAHTYSTPGARFVEVASGPSLAFVRFALSASLLPSFLGGGRRRFVVLVSNIKHESLELIANWLKDGTVKTVTDQVFSMDDAISAFTRLKTGRARGKVIVNVSGENWQ